MTHLQEHGTHESFVLGDTQAQRGLRGRAFRQMNAGRLRVTGRDGERGARVHARHAGNPRGDTRSREKRSRGVMKLM